MVAKTRSTEDQQLAQEFFAAVDYHLGFADTAASKCSQALYEFEVNLDHTGDSYYINRRDPFELIQWGDIAVREAASVIEVGWVAINHLLALGLDPTRPSDMRWRADGGTGKFQQALRALAAPSAASLANTIGSLFESIGYDLLTSYRNWVTHRGAPLLEPPDSVIGPIAVPEGFAHEADPQLKHWLLKTDALLQASNVQVTCWSIAPPVQMTYSAHIGATDTPISLPGVFIDAGSRDIRIENMRVQSGDLWDSADEFKARNPLRVDKGQRRVCGEDLATYSGGDYVMAVGQVVRFSAEAYGRRFDVLLAQTMEELGGT